MDREKIVTSVIASLTTAVLIFLGSALFGFFTVKIEETQIPAIARTFINDPNSREALLSAMEQSGAFAGEKGDQGEQGIVGDRGTSGPPWIPTGAIILMSKNHNCPENTRSLADFNIQTYRQSNFYEATKAVATSDSSWDINTHNWDGLTYRVCMFE